MTTLAQIQQFAQRLGETFLPQRVILFGSYAYGQPTRDSDVDLMVIMPLYNCTPIEKSVEIRLKLRPSFPMDILVRTPERVRERLAIGDIFMREVLSKGRVLYEINHA